MHLQIRIISAHRLPRAKVINPFVSLALIGLKCDAAQQQTEVRLRTNWHIPLLLTRRSTAGTSRRGRCAAVERDFLL